MGAEPGMVGAFVGVGDGDGLVDPGDGDGELLPGGVDAGEDCGDPGATAPWPLGMLLGSVCGVLGWVDDDVAEPQFAWLPEPLGVPPPSGLLEPWEPDEFRFSKENPN